MSQGDKPNMNKEVAEVEKEVREMQRELTSLQMRRANLSYQLTHLQGRIEDCEKHIVTLQEQFTSKVRVLEVLKESSRYVKMPPASPYGNKKRAREEKPTEEAPEGEIDAVDVSDKK